MTNFKPTTLHFFLIVSILMLGHKAYSQTNIDRLKNDLNKAIDSNKVDVLNKISKHYEKKIPDSSMFYATQAETSAIKLSYTKGQVAAIKNKGNYYVRIGDFERAFVEYDKALVIYTEENDKDGIQKILNNKGNAYRVSGNYDQALYYFFESLKLSEKEGIKQGIAYASLNIGIVYNLSQEKDNDQGLPYFLEALKICKEINDERCVAYAINNIAIIYSGLENYDKALEYLNQALALKKAINDNNGVASSLRGIGDIYYKKGAYETALKFNQQGLEISRALKDERGIINSLLDMGTSSYALERFNEGIVYLDEALLLSKESNSLNLLSASYQHLHDLYSAQNNHKKALEYYLLHTKIKDSMYNETSSKQIAEIRTLYDTEKKEAEITQLTNEKTIQDLELKKSENMKLFFILASSLIFLLAGFIFYAFKQKQKANILLKERNTFEIENKKKAISLFGQQVSKEVALELLSDTFNSGSKELFACIMFLDIRNFTPFTENKKPAEIIQFQNDIFGFMIDSISKHHGIINQFLGDGFMATFGAPASSGNDCQNAVNAALDISQQLKQLCNSGAIPKTKIGIGLHAGPIITGNVGTLERKQYSITGNTVILASRIEQLNKQFNSEVLISKEVLKEINKDNLKTENLGKVNLKGRSKPIEIVRLV